MILTKKEKEHMVIQLASQGKTTREIAKAAHISPKDIAIIIRRFTGDEKDYQNKSPSITSKAFQMFKESKSKVDVAIVLYTWKGKSAERRVAIGGDVSRTLRRIGNWDTAAERLRGWRRAYGTAVERARGGINNFFRIIRITNAGDRIGDSVSSWVIRA